MISSPKSDSITVGEQRRIDRLKGVPIQHLASLVAPYEYVNDPEWILGRGILSECDCDDDLERAVNMRIREGIRRWLKANGFFRH